MEHHYFGFIWEGGKCPYPWDLLCLKHLTIHIKHTSALQAESHRSKLTARFPVYTGGCPILCRDSTGLTVFCCLGLLGWFGGRTGQDKILHVLSLLFPGDLQNSHHVPLLNAVWGLQELAMWKKVIILCPRGRRSTGELESTAGWGQQQFIGLENYVGFTFYTPVNSDFHEVGGVATATVVSHHFCCLCHRDRLILS